MAAWAAPPVALAARQGAADLAEWATYPATQPVWPLDGAFASADLWVDRVQVIGETASDHRGLAVAYRLLSVAETARQDAWHARVRNAQGERILACDFGSPPAADDPRVGWLQRVLGRGLMDTVPTIL